MTHLLKTFLKSIVFVVILFALQGCSGGRDLSTPSGRFHGHWSTDNGKNHYYFGPLDSSQSGSFTVKFGERVAIHQGYRILSEVQDTNEIVAKVTFGDGDSEVNKYYPSKDGNTMRMELNSKQPHGEIYMNVSNAIYVDGKTSP